MQNLIKYIIPLGLFTFFASPSIAVNNGMSQEEFARGSYIFVFKNNIRANKVSRLARQISSGKGPVHFTYKHTIKGFSASMSHQAASRIAANNPNIAYVEQNQVAYSSAPGGGKGGQKDKENTTPPPEQVIPWGITRVGAGESAYSAEAGLRVAWVIDTGIDGDHPDLNVDKFKSSNFVTKGRKKLDSSAWDDGNGHGTHVAGTIAAIDNEIGVIGVAHGATVVAVKVLDDNGSGSYAAVLAGIDYVAQEADSGDVANMSLGGGISQALDDAVIAAATLGIKFVIAAGNESDDAINHSPARAEHGNIYTVSAIDIDDKFAYFSNYGNPPIDYAAPGVGIESTWKDGGYNRISGTSMAAPHVAGLLLITNTIHTDGTALGDQDGEADLIAHH